MIEKVSGSYHVSSSPDVPRLARQFHDVLQELISSMNDQDPSRVAKAVCGLEPICREADQC